jgi:hypothetical protein
MCWSTFRTSSYIKQANKLGLFDQNISTEHGRVVRDMVVDRACQRVWYFTRLRHAPGSGVHVTTRNFVVSECIYTLNLTL